MEKVLKPGGLMEEPQALFKKFIKNRKKSVYAISEK